MSRNYDNWERLVEAVLDREKLRQLAREDSFNSTTSDVSSCFSFDSTLQEYVPEAPKVFSCNELKKATRNYKSVFEVRESRTEFIGWIDEHTLTAVRPGSGLAVSVKAMPKGSEGRKKWLIGDANLRSKVNYWGQLRHPNLVKFTGYCSEAHGWSLVYEFMPKGSLEMYLLRYELMHKRGDPEMNPSGSRLNQILSWETRVNVAIGVARALCFMHDRKSPVIHGHVKASMILLDEDFNAKLDAFSDELDPDDLYVKDLNSGHTLHPNLLSDLWNYYYLSCKVSVTNDVYNFGVVLLQLLSGLPAYDRQKIRGERNLVEWAKPHMSDERNLFSIMDPRLRNQYSSKEARMLPAIALKCLSPDQKLRPSMTGVLVALERQVKLSSGS